MKIVIANWKMNPLHSSQAELLVRKISRGIKDVKGVKVIICPPFIYLPLVRKLIDHNKVELGGEDLFWAPQGPYTGAISGAMLKNIGCNYVLVGHSERRFFFRETDKIVNNKVRAALREGLIPVLCIGERLKEERSGRTFTVLKREIKKGLRGVSQEELERVFLAYEPIWAIGAEKPCSNKKISDVVLFIREIISRLYNQNVSKKIKILYGGSVNDKNANSIVSETGVDGLLVGRSSLESRQFISLVKSL